MCLSSLLTFTRDIASIIFTLSVCGEYCSCVYVTMYCVNWLFFAFRKQSNFSFHLEHHFSDIVRLAGQKLESAGVIVDMFPLHNQDKLKDLSEAWYSGNQLAQPLGG